MKECYQNAEHVKDDYLLFYLPDVAFLLSLGRQKFLRFIKVFKYHLASQLQKFKYISLKSWDTGNEEGQ